MADLSRLRRYAMSLAPDPDSELSRPIPFPDDPTDRHPVDADTWWGFLCLAVVGLTCLGGTYCTGYVADSWPAAATCLYMINALVSMGIGVLVVRKVLI